MRHERRYDDTIHPTVFDANLYEEWTACAAPGYHSIIVLSTGVVDVADHDIRRGNCVQYRSPSGGHVLVAAENLPPPSLGQDNGSIPPVRYLRNH